MHELDAFLQHAGVKGMRWGVHRDRNRPGGADGRPDASDAKRASRPKKGKLDSHEALVKFGKNPIKNTRKISANLDAHHIDPKTGEYTHRSKTAKTVRVVDKVLGVANTVLLSTTY